MYFRIASSLLLLIAFSCSKPNPEAQKQNLEGYWEIKAVEMPDGSKKQFGVNTIVDHIEVKADSGVRTKVSPKLDGSFTTNGVSENFILKIEDDSLRMHYKTPYDEWTETILESKDSTLIVKNRQDLVYTYRKFKKFDLVN
ncbi:lipocalin family protein [Aequorivita viscosa]|uniref:Lipocalin-like domain-containing protein n=1 Tax=Aequorivita viscosa TaxID=797419 RepID=A0A1M6B5W3_9FLAO|nr:lipocalin family protein [Aequorivita viscosa]SDW33537.1 hypothetical protein SAMN05216556_104115 [Aequorivita viscosa]SHI44132.1 hypothetical protein SAMN04487908_102112 [Aequorivita viscosa]